VADWHREPATDDLLDGLPPAALAAVRQVAEELTVRQSMIFLDGRAALPRLQHRALEAATIIGRASPTTPTT